MQDFVYIYEKYGKNQGLFEHIYGWIYSLM